MIKLFPYQIGAIDKIHKDLSGKTNGVIMSLPTGTGKTVTAVAFVRDRWVPTYKRCRVLWVIHRQELLSQAEATFKEMMPDIRLTKWTAQHKDSTGEVVLAMIGSTRKLTGEFDLIIFDEAHHFALPADEDDDYHSLYISLLERVQCKKKLGLTATPSRLDERPLGFNKISVQYSFMDMVKKGRLSMPIYMEMRTKLRYELKSLGGEFTETSLSQLDSDDRNKKIVDDWVDKHKVYGKTLMFAVNVEHAKRLAALINERIPGAAQSIDGETPTLERKAKLAWFKEGDFNKPKVLTNCQVFIEGMDEPSIHTIFLTRPTGSKVYWMQMVGRGARIVYGERWLDNNRLNGCKPVGDDGVHEYSYWDPNIKEDHGQEVFRGEEIGWDEKNNNPHSILVRTQKCNSFYLVNIMDDITKYPILVEEWQLDIREATEEDLEKKRIREKVEKKYKDIKEIEKLTGADFEIRQNELIDVRAVVIFSTYFSRMVGVPLDEPRLMCLYRLKEYVESCIQNGQTDTERFESAYPTCVPNGELPSRIFNEMKWAYFNKYVKGLDYITYKKDGRDYPSWSIYEMDQMLADGASRARADIELGREKDKYFNNWFSDTHNTNSTVKKIIAVAKDMAADISPQRLWVFNTIAKHLTPSTTHPIAQNRIFFLSYTGPSSGKEIGFVKVAASLLTKGAQKVLDDPSILFRIKIDS